jgi:hypothetical protein
VRRSEVRDSPSAGENRQLPLLDVSQGNRRGLPHEGGGADRGFSVGCWRTARFQVRFFAGRDADLLRYLRFYAANVFP